MMKLPQKASFGTKACSFGTSILLPSVTVWKLWLDLECFPKLSGLCCKLLLSDPKAAPKTHARDLTFPKLKPGEFGHCSFFLGKQRFQSRAKRGRENGSRTIFWSVQNLENKPLCWREDDFRISTISRKT